MKTLLPLLAVALCAGCTFLSYTSPTGAKLTRTAVGLNVNVGSLDVLTETNEIKAVRLRGYVSDGAATSAAVTEAAVRAALGK